MPCVLARFCGREWSGRSRRPRLPRHEERWPTYEKARGRLRVACFPPVPELFPCAVCQPTQRRPLEGGEPGDDQCGAEVVERPPGLEEPRAVDRYEAEGDPVAQAVATAGELSQPGAPPFHPVAKSREQGCLAERERHRRGHQGQQGNLAQERVTPSACAADGSCVSLTLFRRRESRWREYGLGSDLQRRASRRRGCPRFLRRRSPRRC